MDLPNTVVEDGNTILKTFNVTKLSEDYLKTFDNFFDNNHNLLLFCEDGKYLFVTVSDGSNIDITNSSKPNTALLRTTSSTDYLSVMSFSRLENEFVFENYVKYYGVEIEFNGIAMGSYLTTTSYTLPNLGYDYLGKYTGTLQIVDDRSPEKENIFDWLSNFWIKLVDTIKSLFIPSSDYFKNFFEEIKEAFDSRMGGVSGLFSSLGDIFSQLDNITGESNITISIKDNHFFNGYKGINIDVLTYVRPLIGFLRGFFNASMSIFTIIYCYQKLIIIIRG